MHYIRFLIISAVVVGVIGVGYLVLQKFSATATYTGKSVSSVKAVVGKPAPDFTVTESDGKQFSVKAEKRKPIILFGMASWCGECIGEGQALTKIQQTYGKSVRIIGIAFTQDDTNTTIKQYKQLGKVNVPIALDTDNVMKKYNLVNLDTTYFINKQGIITYKSEGAMAYSDIQHQLDKIL